MLTPEPAINSHEISDRKIKRHVVVGGGYYDEFMTLFNEDWSYLYIVNELDLQRKTQTIWEEITGNSIL